VDWAATEREKANLIAGRPVDESKIDPVVLESWRRSLRAGVDPWETKYIISGASAASAYPDIFIELAAIERDDGLLKLICDYSAETGTMVEITDAKGKLVKILASPGAELVSVLHDAEHIVGTNAVSMALRLQRPVQLHGPEHFNIHISNSDASSAPIRGLDGGIIGVLNIAGRRSRHGRDTLFASAMLAGMIGDYLILSQYQNAVESCGGALSGLLDALREPDEKTEGQSLRTAQNMLKSLNQKMERIQAVERHRGALYRHTAGMRQLEQSPARSPGRTGNRAGQRFKHERIFRLDDIIDSSAEIVKAK
jgi:transcriptional regulator of acetoin/glycerol metabolism